jgi:hypothetical protein
MPQDSEPQSKTIAQVEKTLSRLSLSVNAALQTLSEAELRKLISEIETGSEHAG